MKASLILTLMVISFFMVSADYVDSDQGIEMQLASELVFEEKVKIYDYEGNLLEEYIASDVVNDEISASDYYALQESDYAFNYLGDYYYFTEKLETLGAN